MASISGFNEVTNFYVQFLKHQGDPNAHIHLNNNFGDAVPDGDKLFFDPFDREELLDDKKLLPLLRELITTKVDRSIRDTDK